ncbi:MAG: hypothetical protein CTY32_06790 [Methylotenera sp.]|nr:MAG: hypothetical protein CTY32_06790 [Methylotenera sp.]
MSSHLLPLAAPCWFAWDNVDKEVDNNVKSNKDIFFIIGTLIYKLVRLAMMKISSMMLCEVVII